MLLALQSLLLYRYDPEYIVQRNHPSGASDWSILADEHTQSLFNQVHFYQHV